jgi:CarD family transcriptional regulator
MEDYKVGDNAVYPGHGVVTITAIEAQEMYGTTQTFYRMLLFETGLTVLIPVNKAEAKGLRPIINTEEAKKVLSIVQQKNVKIDNQTWNRRYREYMEKIKTGSVYEIAEVFRDLFILKGEKELSFGEKKMLDLARCHLFKELELSMGMDKLKQDAEIAPYLEAR